MLGPASHLGKVRSFLLPLCAAAVCAGTVFARASAQHIDFDEAYNLQIAKSIATHFTYANLYHPVTVFPSSVSTNGLMQYVAACIFLFTRNIDLVVSLTATVGILILTFGAMRLRRDLAVAPLLMILLWPGFLDVATEFMGEVWAIGLMLHGIAWLRESLESRSAMAAFRSRAFTLAVVAFGLAILSKLIVIFAVGCVALAYGLRFATAREVGARRQAITQALVFWLGTWSLSVLVCVASIAISVIHSDRLNVLPVIPTAYAFFQNSFAQGTGHSALPFALAVKQLGSPFILASLALCTASLLIDEWAFLPLVTATAIGYFGYGITSREMLPYFALIAVLGIEAFEHLLAGIGAKFNLTTQQTRFGTAVAGTAIIILMVTATGTQAQLLETAATSDAVQNRDSVQTSQGLYRYSNDLLTTLDKYEYVVTSGWWQFPEISIRSDREFYDRMAPQNAQIPRTSTVLFIDKGNHAWPVTSVQANCARLVYSEGPLVLCIPRKEKPLSYQAQ